MAVRKKMNLTDLKNNEMSFVEKKKMSSKMVVVWPKKAGRRRDSGQKSLVRVCGETRKRGKKIVGAGDGLL
jgi:hypothetical protein